MGRTLLALLLLASTASAHPRRALTADGRARPLDFIGGAADPRGNVLVRQLVAASATEHATSRVIYLNGNGARLRPGDNDSATQTSSIVTEQVDLGGWDIDQASWDQLVGCVQAMYARWDVVVTDQEPSVSHIEALIGGSPLDVGLPDNVAGVSPFTQDCGVIDDSIVFTFTDVLDDNPQLVCEIVSQEIAHSFGLDHELLAEDPMTYLDYAGPRTFQDTMAHCGEYDERDCGINGNVCRRMQSSVQTLDARLGIAGGTSTKAANANSYLPDGCSAGGGASRWLLTVGLLYLLRSRRA